jgi:hypothetical protein
MNITLKEEQISYALQGAMEGNRDLTLTEAKIEAAKSLALRWNMSQVQALESIDEQVQAWDAKENAQ